MADNNNFSDALAAWKEINLGELQKTLDAQGVELVENQKESVVGRKALADKTREFKKLPDEEKLGEFKALLKAYQTEIDNLTRRTKSSETAFLSVYKILAEAPDPYPLLDAAIDQMVKVGESKELEAEIQLLKSENAELKRKVLETSTLETAKKRAEDKVEAMENK
ncbi:4098_t:CDS:2, partial [Acaulospora colombiana]